MAHYIVYKDDPIVMHRGDHFEMPIRLLEERNFALVNPPTIVDPTNNIRYSLKKGEKLYVGIMEPGKPFECSVIRKTYTSKDTNAWGDITFELKSKDTECLLPGKYFIEAKALDFDGEVRTILPKRSFRILD